MTSINQSFFRRLIRWRFLIVVNLVVIIFLGMSFGREVVRGRSIDAQISELKERTLELSIRNTDLLAWGNALQSESFIERSARLKLGMKKPGETVLIIKQPNETQIASDRNDFSIDQFYANEALANPTKWWYYFFNKNIFNSLSNYD